VPGWTRTSGTSRRSHGDESRSVMVRSLAIRPVSAIRQVESEVLPKLSTYEGDYLPEVETDGRTLTLRLTSDTGN